MTSDPVHQTCGDYYVLPFKKLSMIVLKPQLEALQRQLTVWCICLVVHRAVMKHAWHSDEACKAVLSARQHKIMPSSL